MSRPQTWGTSTGQPPILCGCWTHSYPASLLAIAIAAVLPALRLALDRAVLTVRLPVVCAMLRISEACAGDAMQACHAWCSCFKQGMGSLQACRRKAV